MAASGDQEIYGMLLESVQHYLQEEFGEAKWEEIRVKAGIASHSFVTHKKYPQDSMQDLARAKVEVLREEGEDPAADNMRYFGKCFVKFFMHYGYDRIIRVSGRHFRDFLIGIDSLHEHMRFGYAKLQSPTFYCEEETSSGLVLHYTSKRHGYMNYVIGQLEQVASMFFNINVSMQVLDNKTDETRTHVVYRLGFDNTGYKPVEPGSLSLSLSKTIPLELFFNMFPMSFAINSDMTITMAGSGLTATIGNRLVGCDVRDRFILRRPKTDFTWEALIKRHVVFELICKIPTLRRSGVNSLLSYGSCDLDQNNGNTNAGQPSIKSQPRDSILDERTRTMHLKGEMIFLQKCNKVLYIASPVIGSLEDMIRNGLYMSDLSMHDTSLENALFGLKPLHQLELARDQQLDKSKVLEENMEKLAAERALSEELLYRMMPKPVADRIRRGDKAISTCEYFDSVTVMFTYMDGFVNICSRVTAMEAVSLVNAMFVKFDNLTEKHDVYKFETLGDALYMVVNGAPIRKELHTEPMADMALDMVDAVRDLKDPSTNKAITISTGMHMGSVAAGLVGEKTPQYCLFGDTVNIASRLRTTSMPMRIHISATCNHVLEETKFKTEFRGHIELKGKGRVKTYWLTGRKNIPTGENCAATPEG